MSETKPELTVGGQAVIEGVMMRAPTGWAVAVRTPSGEIVTRSADLPRLSTRSRWARIPLIRGILVLGESLTLGFRSLSWSAQMAVGEDEEPLSRKEMTLSMGFAMLLFAGIFIVAPAAIARWTARGNDLGFSIIEGAIRLGLFIGYIWLIGRFEEIRRVFQYHGAEHMTIHAYEAGGPLTEEEVRRYPPAHPRCGTSFLMIVVLASIVVFAVIGDVSWVWLIGSRLLFIPVIAGASYELLRFSGLSEGLFARALAAPGLWLQRLTTGQPEDDMIPVAIASLLVALDDEAVAEVKARGPVAPEALAVLGS